ncbi:HEAT repeat domain-containing protein [Gemmata sp. JC717]|uniref:aldo/keto reductase n=1 Tax=Gemmata algarum TaxID=2975278 RepID=UPI0021BB4B0F|nr:aldo/keto reductase [Gemmata algarum]MDY3554560.1 HEAT repeat domain-containing protein [Gemmata algarum]
MRVPNDHPLARSYALLDPNTAASVALAFRGTVERAEIEGLVELVLNREARATDAAAALRSLEHDTSELVADTIVRATGSPHPSVRIAAVGEVARRKLFGVAERSLVQLLTADAFWQVRRAALNALAEAGRREVLAPASNDPHWRVRYALAQWLETWGRDPATRAAVLGLLVLPKPHVERLRAYLHYRWTGETPAEGVTDDPSAWCPFWDWDPAVLARNLELLGRSGRRDALPVLARLVNHPDERVRSWVVLALREDGSVAQWAHALSYLGDPREDTAPVLDSLTRGVELDRVEEVAKHILAMESPPLAALKWAAAQAGEVFPAEEAATDLVRLRPQLVAVSEPTEEPFPDTHPYSRAAALTPARANELIEHPTQETSWFVLARAAKLCRVPIWHLAPQAPWKAPAVPREPVEPLSLPAINLVRPRQIGPGGPVVSPLGVSGHYGLPVEGYLRAAEQGVNLFFWEPNYVTLTRFMTRLSPADRRGVHVLVGTFEADPVKIRKDVERALRNMKLERISIFLIFWTQSWQRITPDVRAELDRLKADGLVQVYGLSTHNRGIARDAIIEGWNPVMVRHSAAHRKAETEVLPFARERGISVLTFNNTCYGRLLDPSFRPSDCFRYTLNTPGVSACFTAPSNLEYLEENLDALRNPELADEVREKLLKRGAWMYREDTVFRKTVRAEV